MPCHVAARGRASGSANRTGLEPVYVSRLVRALERDGFLTRSVNPADPRAVELALTNRGEVAVQDGIKVVYELRERLTVPLGGNDGVRTAELAEIIARASRCLRSGSLYRAIGAVLLNRLPRRTNRELSVSISRCSVRCLDEGS